MRHAALLLAAIAAMGSARPAPPRVEVLSYTFQTCAVSGHDDFRPPHAHLAIRARVIGAAPGDLLAATVKGTPPVLFPADQGVVTVEFPAGIGAHEVTFAWTDAAGKVKGAGFAWPSVWECRG